MFYTFRAAKTKERVTKRRKNEKRRKIMESPSCLCATIATKHSSQAINDTYFMRTMKYGKRTLLIFQISSAIHKRSTFESN